MNTANTGNGRLEVDEKYIESFDLHPFLAYARGILSEPISDLDSDSSEDSKWNNVKHGRIIPHHAYGGKFIYSDTSESSSSSNDEDYLIDIDSKVRKIVEQYYLKSKGLSYERRKAKKTIADGPKVKKKRGRKPKSKAEPVKPQLSSSDEGNILEEDEDAPFGGYYDEDDSCENSSNEMWCKSRKSKKDEKRPRKKGKPLSVESLTNKRKKLWVSLCKKEINKASKQLTNCHKELLALRKKMAMSCMRFRRQQVMGNQKNQNNVIWQAKRLTREMQSYWKRYDRVEREIRKKAEKEALEQKRQDVEFMEAKRQQRKLNFLITQTELYAHFMSRKLGGGSADDERRILGQLEEEKNPNSIDFDDYNSDKVKEQALQNVHKAMNSHEDKTTRFDDHMVELAKSDALKLNETNIPRGEEHPQPTLFEGQLKAYQLKGMNWIANLYGQGINGILADEMGLGKTVQSIAFLTHIAERYGVWGPFLVVCPASTLHNWQQEIHKFAPAFKVVPYWGNTQERKILRQFWNQKNLYTKDASIHICVTSYQLVITDFKYFHRIKWQYMILDEAQAIKSTSSTRWKMLLGFHCRNRLLLTGTPIQNSMAELWALLHFIMPSLFDSHQEFNEWFSKDIESHAENKSSIDQKHLSRLHMILKPFMLRRIKKDVENELSEKIEIMMYCSLTNRQQLLYKALKKKIKIEDLLHSSCVGSSSSQSVTSNLMNLVMQFRKVCNHPELFERREAKSPCSVSISNYVVPKLIYEDLYLDLNSSRQKLLYATLCIFAPSRIHESLNSNGNFWSLFNFIHFCDISPKELSEFYLENYYARLRNLIWLYQLQTMRYCRQAFHKRNVDRISFMIDMPLSYVSFQFSHNLSGLLFCSIDEPFLEYSVYTIFDAPLANKDESKALFMKKEEWDEKSVENDSPRNSPIGTSLHLDEESNESYAATTNNACIKENRPRKEFRKTLIPLFLFECCPTVLSKPMEVYCCSQRAQLKSLQDKLTASPPTTITSLFEETYSSPLYPYDQRYLPSIFRPIMGWSKILLPRKQCLVTDAGKLRTLDSLLMKLKEQGHRVLIYSQMTRMIDLLEEYMWFRKWTYMRLDGSSKISDRRDMVANFQNRDDIFVFLLSTRAGGLGINLTAADTVIFYDSDWNPTVDQQAMDRAHRLGQTKQVTVYRLICQGTIEERILQRAKEKSEIQRMVISGGNFKPDTLKPKEVVSLLLDDEEIERKYRQRQLERKQQELEKEKDRKRKIEPGDNYDLKKIKEEGPKEGLPNEDRIEDLFESSTLNGDNVNLLGISTKPKRGTGKRGRPKGSGKIKSLERNVKTPAPKQPSSQGRGQIAGKRGPGRPRLKPVGPGNQGTRYYFSVTNTQELQVPIGKNQLTPSSSPFLLH